VAAIVSVVEIEDRVELNAHDVALLLLAPFVFLLLELELVSVTVCLSPTSGLNFCCSIKNAASGCFRNISSSSACRSRRRSHRRSTIFFDTVDDFIDYFVLPILHTCSLEGRPLKQSFGVTISMGAFPKNESEFLGIMLHPCLQ